MVLNKFVWYIIFLPLGIGLYQFKKLSISHRFLYWFIVLGTITETTSRISKKLFVISNNMPLGHVYISLSFLLLALFYLYELQNFINKKVIIAIIVIFELFCLHNAIFFQSHLTFPSIPGAISALLLVAFAILSFANIMREGKIRKLSDSSLIWINSAVLFYFSGNFFYYTLYNFILNYSREFSILTINFLALINTIFYALIAVGLWKAGKQKQT